ETKGGLLADSYQWILENDDFKQWRNDQQIHLLWIKGDPGKSKTMLLCGIIDELKKSTAETHLLSFFFCQATDSRINNATAILRGLLYFLIDQQPSLISHIQQRHDLAGKSLFEDANAWVSLSDIFTSILQDPSLKSTYLIIDALGECVITDLPKLLDFIIEKSSISPRVKWIVSSRNWPNIEKNLDAAMQKVRLCLELNETSISAAVAAYIQFKVDWLAKRNRYEDYTRDAVQNYLLINAKGTFLWVALICRELSNTSAWKVQGMLTAFPPGLGALYQRMTNQICDSEDAGLCKRILAVVLAAYRPLTLDELTSFVDVPNGVYGNGEALLEIIGLCGSFLTVRERIIFFVHQSAKDFLLKDASHKILPSGIEDTHRLLFSRSGPLTASRYSCVYWIDHLLDSKGPAAQDEDLGDANFLRKKYLYLPEALSLCRSMSDGVISMSELEDFLQGRTDSALIDLVRDARRFVMYHKWAIEKSPLQVYASALMFSPARSLIRALFKEEEPEWITITPGMADEWSTCLQTLEGHSNTVYSVAFSHAWTQLASASDDNTVKIWDAGSGKCLHTLEGHSNTVRSVAFSHDSTRLASTSGDNTVKIWDTGNGKCLHTLETGKTLSHISFDLIGSYLRTDIGTIVIGKLPARNGAASVRVSQNLEHKGVGLCPDAVWNTYNSKKLLWLPPEFRPSCSAVWHRIWEGMETSMTVDVLKNGIYLS
ncbi:hypothetical protein Egran_00579, partial [Elaphomyces granulatus]